jgi:hypothetical protein
VARLAEAAVNTLMAGICGPKCQVTQAAQSFPLARGEEAQRKEDARRGYPERSVRGTTLRPSIKHAYWALAQYDFVYKRQPGRKADERAPLFLGVFDWNDSEDDELLAAWARGEG